MPLYADVRVLSNDAVGFTAIACERVADNAEGTRCPARSKRARLHLQPQLFSPRRPTAALWLCGVGSIVCLKQLKAQRTAPRPLVNTSVQTTTYYHLHTLGSQEGRSKTRGESSARASCAYAPAVGQVAGARSSVAGNSIGGYAALSASAEYPDLEPTISLYAFGSACLAFLLGL